MNTTKIPTSWWQALSLSERGVPANGSLHDAQRSLRTLTKWTSQPPFDIPEVLEKRLSTLGLSLKDFSFLCAESSLELSRRVPPPTWLADLERLYSDNPRFKPPTSQLPRLPSQAGISANICNFLSPFYPLLEIGVKSLHKGLQDINLRTRMFQDVDIFLELLAANLCRRLLFIVNRVMILELHVAKGRGLLSGMTPEERFKSFTDRLSDPEIAREIIDEYPVMLRQVKMSIDFFVEATLELLLRLENDWTEIVNKFFDTTDPGPLTLVESDLSDRHCQGRSVVILTFHPGHRLVYKPRPVAIDQHFQEILHWLGSHGAGDFTSLRILDRGSYGWVEFVSHETCLTEDELRNFYRRQGSYLALLYALGATDIHYENVIAHGEFPVLIDLETLFSPQLPSPEILDTDSQIQQMVSDSVLSVGLLPTKIWHKDGLAGADLSGMGGSPGQVSSSTVLTWTSPGTDEMRIAERLVKLPGAHNNPQPEPSSSKLHKFVQDVASGFSDMYRSLIYLKRPLLDKLDIFKEDPVRAILRTTRSYSLLVQSSYHPDALRDGLERSRLIDRIWAGGNRFPWLQAAAEHESEDISAGDIPYFFTSAGSHSLQTRAGHCLQGFFKTSGLDFGKSRLRSLSKSDLDRQLWLIKASMLTSAMDTVDHFFFRGLPTAPTRNSRSRFFDSAVKVGSRLQELAFTVEDTANWFGLHYSRQRRWVVEPTGLDLYDGLSGISLFLAYLSSFDPRFQTIAEAALQSLRVRYRRDFNAANLSSCGAFEGWGGIVYTLSHLGHLWDRPSLLDDATEIVLSHRESILNADQFDVIGGLSGCIGCILSLYEVRPMSSILEVATLCGERLLAMSQKMETGLGWINADAGQRPLSGFSHGAAGAAWALMRLTQFTGDKRFRAAAEEAWNYESTTFNSTTGNWADLQSYSEEVATNEEFRYSTSWCHGAPGIGLSRLPWLEQIRSVDSQWAKEIDIAVNTTLQEGFGTNHCLCHGDLGNLDFLLEYGIAAQSKPVLRKAQKLATAIEKSIEERGWLCGIPECIEVPGLMTGISGIGYEFLRLAFTDQVPSVLALQGPRR